MRPRLVAEAEILAAVDADRLDDEALRAHWQRARDLHAYGVRCHFRLHVPIGIARFELARICRELFGWDEARTFELMSGLSTASTDAATALAELGARIDSAALRELVERADRGAVAELRAVDPAFAEAFDAYQQQYATRVLSYEFAEPSMRERPELTLATLRDQLRLGFDPAQRAASARQERERTLAEAHRRVRGAEDRARFDAAVALATLAHPIHEENEFYTISRPAALVREATLAVARRAVLAGVIQEADDVFFLTADEVAGVLTGPDARDLVIRRRAERARARRSTPALLRRRAASASARDRSRAEPVAADRGGLDGRADLRPEALGRKRRGRRAHRHTGVTGPLHRDGASRLGRVAIRPDPGRRCAGLSGHLSRVVDPRSPASGRS